MLSPLQHNSGVEGAAHLPPLGGPVPLLLPVPSARKRLRSSSGLPTSDYGQFTPVSDPEIDLASVHTQKRYLSEAMANDLTRHMNLSSAQDDADPMLSPFGADSPRTMSGSFHSDLGQDLDFNPMILSDSKGQTPESTSDTVDSLQGQALADDSTAATWQPGDPSTSAGPARFAPDPARPTPFAFRNVLPRGPVVDMPTSPSDSRYGYDLRKTALLRSISRRAEEPFLPDADLQQMLVETPGTPNSHARHGTSPLCNAVSRSDSDLASMETSSASAEVDDDQEDLETDGAVRSRTPQAPDLLAHPNLQRIATGAAAGRTTALRELAPAELQLPAPAPSLALASVTVHTGTVHTGPVTSWYGLQGSMALPPLQGQSNMPAQLPGIAVPSGTGEPLREYDWDDAGLARATSSHL